MAKWLHLATAFCFRPEVPSSKPQLCLPLIHYTPPWKTSLAVKGLGGESNLPYLLHSWSCHQNYWQSK